MTVTTPVSKQDELQRQIVEAEREMVLAAFAELKKREHGELRIAIRPNKITGVKEIVYIGVHEQQNLERLRRLYAQFGARNGKATTF